MSSRQGVYPLRGIAQNYAWGQLGLESAVGRLISRNESVSSSKPYAGACLGVSLFPLKNDSQCTVISSDAIVTPQ